MISFKNIKPSFHNAVKSGDNFLLNHVDKWLDHVYRLVRFGEPTTKNQDIEAAIGIQLKSDYKQLTVRVQSSTSGNITISADPQISYGVEKQTLTLEGLSDTKTITLESARGLKLSGGTDFVLGENDIITLCFNNDQQLWIEHYRSTNS